MGLEQLKKLDVFNCTRKRNFYLYKDKLVEIKDYVALPEINAQADPVFFGLPQIIIDQGLECNAW